MAPFVPDRAAPGLVRVMLCDDSAVIRGALTRMLESDAAIRVVARAGDGQAAIAQLRPGAIDVAVLDIEMPVMDGLAALPRLLAIDPGLRVIMASTLTTRGAHVALQALRLGAADYLAKPSAAEISGSDTFRAELIARVKGLARLRRPVAAAPSAASGLRPAGARPAALLAIGSSTGGPQALFELVRGLGKRVGVPVVATQHMPPSFTPILAEHITRLGFLPCAEAVHDEPLRPDRIYLAPGDRHLLVVRGPSGLQARLSNGPPENFCRPSVDPMLRSATEATGGRVLAVMLTGMGHDGLEATRALVEQGGTAIAQDEASSVVWGMPGAIARAGLCHAILPLPAIAARVLNLLPGGRC